MKFRLLPALLLAACSLSAELSWKTTQETQKAELFAKDLLYTFEGQNIGDNEIVIEDIRTSCPCITVSASETKLGSGASIVIVAEFDPSEVGGSQNQRIFLKIKGQEDLEVLKVTAQLPEIVSASPKRLFWNLGSEPESKSVEITLSEEVSVALGDVYAMDENFFTSMEQLAENKFLLKVTPRDTGIKRPAAVMIQFTVQGRNSRMTIPCLIAEGNPFEIDFRPKPKARQVSFENLKADLSDSNPDQIQGLQKSQKPTFTKPLSSNK